MDNLYTVKLSTVTGDGSGAGSRYPHRCVSAAGTEPKAELTDTVRYWGSCIAHNITLKFREFQLIFVNKGQFKEAITWHRPYVTLHSKCTFIRLRQTYSITAIVLVQGDALSKFSQC